MSEPASGPARGSAKYERLARLLEADIEGMAPDTALPTERELMKEHGLSRMTVRQAIGRLIAKGLVYNVQGSGTYVANPQVVSKSLRLTSFSEDMTGRGHIPASRVLEHGRVVASPELARRLGLAPSVGLVAVRRLRLADDVPMALERIYLPEDLFDLSRVDFSRSLYEQLSAQGINVSRAAQTIDAVNLASDQAKLLDQAVGAAAIRVSRVSFNDRGRAVEHAETIYRGDRYSFDLVVTRDGSR